MLLQQGTCFTDKNKPGNDAAQKNFMYLYLSYAYHTTEIVPEAICLPDKRKDRSG